MRQKTRKQGHVWGRQRLCWRARSAGALLTAGPASALIRGFKLHNHSRHPLRVESATRPPSVICNSVLRVTTHYVTACDGRPQDGAVLDPGAPPHDWGLKYGSSWLPPETQYATVLTYRVLGTDGTVEYTIDTTLTRSDSVCKVIPAHVGHCTAHGLTLAFRNH